MNEVEIPVRRRVEGSGSGARVAGTIFGLGWTGALFVGYVFTGDSTTSARDPWFVFCLAVACIMIVRSWRIGVFVRKDELTIVSWFSTRSYRIESIDAVLHRPYAGVYTNGAGGNNVLSSRTQMVGIRLASGVERVWPATIMTNRRCRQVTRELAGLLGKPVERIDDI